MWRAPFGLISPQAAIDAMKEREMEPIFSLWVNWEARVISFSADDGFEELHFRTREEKLRFAMERGNEGFGIQ